MSIKIDVTVEDLDLTSVIATKARYDEDDETYVEAGVTLGEMVVRKLIAQTAQTAEYTSLKERIVRVRDEEIRDIIRPLIVEGIEASFQPTNVYGEPKGDPITMRTVVVDQVKDVLRSVKDHNSYDRREPLVRQLVREMVEKELRKTLSEVIDDERKKVVAAVREQAAQLIAEAVTKGVGGK